MSAPSSNRNAGPRGWVRRVLIGRRLIILALLALLSRCDASTTLELFPADEMDAATRSDAVIDVQMTRDAASASEAGANTEREASPPEDVACGGECASSMKCNTQTNACVECISDSDCADGKHCAQVDGTCHECYQDSHCHETGTICNQRTLECARSCASGCETTDVCDTTYGACVDCVTDQNCRSRNDNPLCATATTVCSSCTVKCTKLKCLPTASLCVDCLTDTDCAGEQHLCLTIAHKCVACLTNADCPSGQHCSTEHACI